MISEHRWFYIKELVEYGRGLYAKEDIDFNVVIHEAELVILSQKDTLLAHLHGILKDYLFPYSRFQDAMMLGYGVLFNGDPDKSNVKDEVVYIDHRPFVRFTTRRHILKDEQLFLDYVFNPEEK